MSIPLDYLVALEREHQIILRYKVVSEFARRTHPRISLTETDGKIQFLVMLPGHIAVDEDLISAILKVKNEFDQAKQDHVDIPIPSVAGNTLEEVTNSRYATEGVRIQVGSSVMTVDDDGAVTMGEKETV